MYKASSAKANDKKKCVQFDKRGGIYSVALCCQACSGTVIHRKMEMLVDTICWIILVQINLLSSRCALLNYLPVWGARWFLLVLVRPWYSNLI